MSSIANQINDTNREVSYVGDAKSYTATNDCIVYFKLPRTNYNWTYLEVNDTPSTNSVMIGVVSGWYIRYGASNSQIASVLSKGYKTAVLGYGSGSQDAAIGSRTLKKGETLNSTETLSFFVEKI
jgi:hypothetical protein